MAAFGAIRTGGRSIPATVQSWPWAIRLLANPPPCSRGSMPSFPPCAEAAVDGIFRPEAAGPGW